MANDQWPTKSQGTNDQWRINLRFSDLGFGPLLAIGHSALSYHAVGVVNEQVRDARGVHGAGDGNGGSHGTARSYMGDAPCTAQKVSRHGASADAEDLACR